MANMLVFDSARAAYLFMNLKLALKRIERRAILDALAKHSWVVSRAADELGLIRTTLVEKMRRMKIKRPPKDIEPLDQ